MKNKTKQNKKTINTCKKICYFSQIFSNAIREGLPGVLGNKETKGKYRREQGNMTPVLGNTGT